MVLAVRLLFIATMVLLPATLSIDVGLVRVYTMDIAFVPLLAAVLASAVVSSRPLRFHWQAADYVVLFATAAIALSTLFSEVPALSTAALFDWLRYTLLYFVMRALVANGWVRRPQLVKLWTVIWALLLLIGLLQMLRGDRFGLISNHFGLGTAEGTTANIGAQVVQRVSGPTPNANIYAMWLTLFGLLPMAHWLSRGRYLRFLFGAGITSVVMLSTLARGALAAYALSLLLLAIWYRRVLVNPTASVVALLLVAVAAPFVLLGPWISELRLDQLAELFSARIEDARMDGDAAGRLETVRIGLMVALQDFKTFLLGTGPEVFPADFIIHNVWVKGLAETGLLAALSLAVLLLVFARAAVRMKELTPDGAMWSRYLLALLVPFIVISTQVYPTAGTYHLLVPLMVLIAVATTPVIEPAPRRVPVRVAWQAARSRSRLAPPNLVR